MNNKNNNVVRATLRTATQVIAILAVILVTLIACGKKDDKESVSNKDLIGTWVLESSTIDGKNIEEFIIDGKKMSQWLLTGMGDCYKNRKTKLIFTENKMMAYINIECKEQRFETYYSLSNNRLKLFLDEREFPFPFFVKVIGNKLLMSFSFDEIIDKNDPFNKDFIGKTAISTYVRQ
ncbi:lipocalin family protein [Capnocytophaga leadbetteri]